VSGTHNPEYVERLQETPREIKKREERNKARYQAMKAGLVHKGDGKDVDHIHPLNHGGSNERSNWRVRSRHANRAEGELDSKHRPV
jgi:5-methylcytosine-specific restriction endonuclease McrA